MNRRADRGMTMIDCVIAIGLLTIGGVGLLAIQLVAVSASLQARNLEQATRLAQAQMEAVSFALAAPPDGADTIDGSGCAGAPCQQIGQLFARSWTTSAGSPATIRVTVAWADGQNFPHSVVLDGLR